MGAERPHLLSTLLQQDHGTALSQGKCGRGDCHASSSRQLCLFFLATEHSKMAVLALGAERRS